ncbi:MAG TPA: NADH-quinone oxidoreductase subunit A [Candidatus Aminicenantes bacterium]|nr:NADH-quinone oxidoreductase subunit A [Candidatus Aminicenantes bacterium]
MKNYWYFFLFLVVSIAFSAGLLGFVALIRYRPRPVGDKYEPYECGVEPATATARGATSIRFYLLTLVFIVFEVETVFLFPWAVAHDRLGLFGLVEVLVFLAILVFGYVYAWRAGALEFRRADD